MVIRKLDMVNCANELRDLSSPPSNHLHPIRGGREGQWVISVSGPWRLCFRFEDGAVFDVELVQYQLRAFVADRAENLCEYCLTHEEDTFFGGVTLTTLSALNMAVRRKQII